MMRGTRKSSSRFAALAAAILGMAIVLSGCGSIYDLPLPGGANVGSNPLKLHILFADALDLVPQSTVKVNDVSVGKVTGVNLTTTSIDCPAGKPAPCQVADVSVEIPKNTDLPSNAQALIRQTSLLGEKFVSLCSPGTADCVAGTPSSTNLANNSTLTLQNTGTNPEVEQVLEALGALLSGGGVGQLKVISDQLNQAIGGKESQVRDVLTRLHYFMGQLNGSKSQIVAAVDNLNRLAVSLKKQDPTIVATLNNIPAALASVNNQRSDLVKMLTALNKLSNVGVNVILQSKAATINGLTDLAPVLSQLAAAGDNLPKSFQILLTYPFVDNVVGSTPAAARAFEMGDYTNLSINVDLDLLHLTVPGLPGINLQGILQLCNGSASNACAALGPVVNQLCNALLKGTPLCASTGASTKVGSTKTGSTKTGAKSGSTKSGGTKSGSGGGLLGGLGLGGLLGRTAYGSTSSSSTSSSTGNGMSYLLTQGASQ